MNDARAMRSGSGRRLLLALAATGALLVCLEIGVRTVAMVRGHGFFENPEFEFRSPFFTTANPPPPEFHDDTLQFHDQVIPRVKGPNELRVLCLGGSTTLNASTPRRWCEVLEDLLRPDFPRHEIRVLCAAHNAYSSAHSLVNFALRGLEASPDVVVVYHNLNDSSVNGFGERVEPDYANKYMSPAYLGYQHRTGLRAALMKTSRLARWLEKSVLSIEYSRDSGVSHALDGLPYFRRNLVSLCAVARAHGCEPVLATQAARSDLRDRRVFHTYNDAIREVAAGLSVVLADVAVEVQDDACFSDSLHYNMRGIEEVARAFHPAVRQALQAARE